MIDNRKALGLQAIYKAGRKEALDALYLECVSIASIIVKAECKRRHIYFVHEKIEQIANDAATKLIEMYLKSPDYEVRCFSARLKLNIQSIMSRGLGGNPKQEQFEERVVLMSPDLIKRYGGK